MKIRFLCAGLLVAAATCGCGACLAPHARGYARYPLTAPLSLPPTVEPAAAARGRWDRVMRLAPGTVIDVLTVNGAPNVGRISGADVSRASRFQLPASRFQPHN